MNDPATEPGSEPARAQAPEERRDLGRRARVLGAVLWASFLSAAAGTMFFFAFISPEVLLRGFPESDMFDRIGVYTLGFFGLWLLSALSASLALYLRGFLEGATRRGPP